MAGKSNKPPTNNTTSSTKITRITAHDIDTTPKEKKSRVVKKESKETVSKQENETGVLHRKNPLAAIGGYFAGAWYELRQVRWPTRRATWSMTAAMLVFTAFFAVLILLADALFKYLFELILG